MHYNRNLLILEIDKSLFFIFLKFKPVLLFFLFTVVKVHVSVGLEFFCSPQGRCITFREKFIVDFYRECFALLRLHFLFFISSLCKCLLLCLRTISFSILAFFQTIFKIKCRTHMVRKCQNHNSYFEAYRMV